jgi:hypothetical protein
MARKATGLKQPTWRFRGDPLGELKTQLDQFLTVEKQERTNAALLATSETRNKFRRTRPIAPSRPGRSGNGRMTQSLTWRVTRDGVAFDVAAADSGAQHWIIQEIGTNKRANVLRAGADAVVPRRVKQTSQPVRTVKSQAGRQISRSLAWADGPGRGGTGLMSSPSGLRRNQNLFLRKNLNLPTQGFDPLRTFRIKREIIGQHMVQQGGNKGFRDYETSVYAAASRNLKSKRKKP